MGTATHLRLTLWSTDPTLIGAADAAGVECIGVDLERLGKDQRQSGLGLWLSPHSETDLAFIAPLLRHARLFARCNPPHPGLPDEIERLLAAGVQALMLPAFRHAGQLHDVLDTVAGRARVIPLIELPEALSDVPAIAALCDSGEVHFGLNDLALGLGLRNRFEALLLPEVERACATLRAAGVRVGIGGIAAPGHAGLPVPADLVYARIAALGGCGALLARSFVADLPSEPTARARALTVRIEMARERFAGWTHAGAAAHARAASALRDCVRAVAA